MSNPKASQPEVNQQHKGQPIRERFLVGIGQELSFSIGVDGRPLVGREFVLLNMLVGSPGETLLIPDHLQVYLEVLQGIDLIPIVVGDGSEFASPSLGSGQFMTPEDIADGILTGSLWERMISGGHASP